MSIVGRNNVVKLCGTHDGLPLNIKADSLYKRSVYHTTSVDQELLSAREKAVTTVSDANQSIFTGKF